jgi:hypothetical protein
MWTHPKHEQHGFVTLCQSRIHYVQGWSKVVCTHQHRRVGVHKATPRPDALLRLEGPEILLVGQTALLEVAAEVLENAVDVLSNLFGVPHLKITEHIFLVFLPPYKSGGLRGIMIFAGLISFGFEVPSIEIRIHLYILVCCMLYVK